jgi:hypothetical protein
MNCERLLPASTSTSASSAQQLRRTQVSYIVHRGSKRSRCIQPVLVQQQRASLAATNKVASSNHPSAQPSLERRQALSLGCSERQAVPDIVDTLRTYSSAGSRLRVAVDVDEGEATAKLWRSADSFPLSFHSFYALGTI